MKTKLITLLLITIILCGCTKKEEEKEIFKKFDHLTEEQSISKTNDLFIDLPDWSRNYGENYFALENEDYFIVGLTNDENLTFDELYNQKIKDILKITVNYGNYDEFTFNKKEEIKINDYIPSTKFEGTLKMNTNKKTYDYKTYGYYMNYNNKTIVVMSIETNNNETKRKEIIKYVDEIVQTIRKNK